ncbi:MAG: QueT transporter family protein [Clostridia bacterium]|nr:QueT transporter family protein [Clostridia bacterium]
MKKLFNTKQLCRAGIIAALYVVFTYVFLPFAFGPIQIRPAEALCILPLFFPEAVPALYVGCMIVNFSSAYALYDVLFGSLATLIAAFGTYMVGSFLKKGVWKVLIGGLFPVVCNTLIIPLIIVFLCRDVGQMSATVAYWTYASSIFFTECIWVYGLGAPLYAVLSKQKDK